MANKAYRYRAYPNKEQELLLQKTFGCARYIWNAMLGDMEEHYNKTGKKLNVTPAKYKKEHEWLKEVDSLALANVQLNLKQAFNAFFSKPSAGYPKFKAKKHSKKSYTTNLVNGNIQIRDKTIRLPKVGEIKIRKHREAPEHYQLKSVTVSQESSGKYYVSVLYEYENQVIMHTDTEKSCGIDFMMSGLYMDDQGNSAEMPRYFRNAAKRLARAQRKLSKMYVKGEKEHSKRYEKQKHRVALLHEKVRNQRMDFLHKTSSALLEKNDYIFIEDLDMKEMSQHMDLGKGVSDNGWRMFTDMLEYKAEERGKHVIRIDRYYPSSQKCHVCGKINSAVKDLRIRKWECPKCGTYHDRDHNAARNIKAEGLRLVTLQ